MIHPWSSLFFLLDSPSCITTCPLCFSFSEQFSGFSLLFKGIMSGKTTFPRKPCRPQCPTSPQLVRKRAQRNGRHRPFLEATPRRLKGSRTKRSFHDSTRIKPDIGKDAGSCFVGMSRLVRTSAPPDALPGERRTADHGENAWPASAQSSQRSFRPSTWSHAERSQSSRLEELGTGRIKHRSDSGSMWVLWIWLTQIKEHLDWTSASMCIWGNYNCELWTYYVMHSRSSHEKTCLIPPSQAAPTTHAKKSNASVPEPEPFIRSNGMGASPHYHVPKASCRLLRTINPPWKRMSNSNGGVYLYIYSPQKLLTLRSLRVGLHRSPPPRQGHGPTQKQTGTGSLPSPSSKSKNPPKPVARTRVTGIALGAGPSVTSSGP